MLLKGIYKHTEEAKRKISESNRRRIFSNITKQKIGLANTKEKIVIKCLGCEKDFKVRPSESMGKRKRLYCSKPCVYISSDYRKKRAIIGKKWSGKKHNIESRIKMSLSHKGKKSSLWKGGITSINMQIRQSFEYKLWRKAVFERDNYTCVWCGQKGYLNADHIKPFSLFPEFRFAIDNGRTLCKDCHKTTETYGIKARNFKNLT